MAAPGPDGPRAGGPNEQPGVTPGQYTPPQAATSPWQPAKGRVYRATGWYDEPQTIPSGVRLPPADPTVPPPRPAPVLPKTKGPWALTHLTTSLTGDILGGHGSQPTPKAPSERRTGQIVLLLLIGLGLLVLLGAITAYLLSDFFGNALG